MLALGDSVIKQIDAVYAQLDDLFLPLDNVFRVVGIQFLNDAVENISQQAKLPVDVLKTLTAILLSVVFAIIYRLLTQKRTLIQLFVLSSGLWTTFFMFGRVNWIHIVLVPTCCYIFMRCFPHGVAHRLVAVFTVTYLTASYMHKYWTTDFETLGGAVNRMTFTLVLCVMTLKLNSLAVNYYDSSRDLPEKMRQGVVKQMPSLLDVWSYSFFFAGFVVGPTFEFNEYLAFMKGTAGGVVPPGGPRVGFLRLVTGGVMLVVVQLLINKAPANFMRSDEFLHETSFGYKLVYFSIVGHLCNLRYCLTWMISETAALICGLGFGGMDKEGKAKWDRMRNANIKQVEFGLTLSSFVVAFNMRTNHWMSTYINRRMQSSGFSRNAGMFGTFFFLALWHGVYPGYFLCFIGEYTLVSTERSLKRLMRPVWEMSKDNIVLSSLYNVASSVSYHLGLYFIQIPFWLLETAPSMAVWGSIFYFVPAFQLLVFVLDYFVPAPPAPKPAAKKE